MNGFDADQQEYLTQSFSGLDLSAQQLNGKEFDACSFRDCNLSEADLSRSRFIDCHFERCNLSNANLGLCRFSEVEFVECKLVGLDWTRATWSNLSLPAPVRFMQCILNDSSFFGLYLAELVMEECKAHDVDLREGDFSQGNFRYTDLSHALFGNSNLSGADFSEAHNYYIDVLHNRIEGARFSRHEAVEGLLGGLGIELVD